MDDQQRPSPDGIVTLVQSSLEEILSLRDDPPEEQVTTSTRLIGREAIIDSLGLVGMITELEEKLEEDYGISIIIADDRAMSQHNSPFRTVQSLADYITLLIDEV